MSCFGGLAIEKNFVFNAFRLVRIRCMLSSEWVFDELVVLVFLDFVFLLGLALVLLLDTCRDLLVSSGLLKVPYLINSISVRGRDASHRKEDASTNGMMANLVSGSEYFEGLTLLSRGGFPHGADGFAKISKGQV